MAVGIATAALVAAVVAALHHHGDRATYSWPPCGPAGLDTSAWLVRAIAAAQQGAVVDCCTSPLWFERPARNSPGEHGRSDGETS